MQDPISSREHFHSRIVDLKIEDVAFGGKGVGRENGKAVFVPFTIDGEMISAQITREKKQFAEAEVAVISTSITNISSQLSGGRCATFCNESESSKTFRCGLSSPHPSRMHIAI